MEREIGVFLGPAEALGEGDAGGEAVLHLLRQAAQHRRGENPRCDRAHTNARPRSFPRQEP